MFTGFVGVVAAVTLIVQGNSAGDLASIRGAGYTLLFAFTYLWVAANNFLNAGGRAFGWYCLFVAITAIPAGIWSFANAQGNAADIPRRLLVCLGRAVVPLLLAACARPAGRQARGCGGDPRGHRDRMGVRDPAARKPDRLLDAIPLWPLGGSGGQSTSRRCWLLFPRYAP